MEAERLRQVHEARGNTVFERKPERLPLRREMREGIEGRLVRALGRVDQQGHGRPHLLMHQERQYVMRVRRPLHQHDVRPQRVERLLQTARTAGPVVPDAKDVNGHG